MLGGLPRGGWGAAPGELESALAWRQGLGGGGEFIAGLSIPVLRNLGLPERCPPAPVERGSQTSPLCMEILGPRAGV